MQNSTKIIYEEEKKIEVNVERVNGKSKNKKEKKLWNLTPVDDCPSYELYKNCIFVDVNYIVTT